MWYNRYPTLRTVIVNTRTGKTFRGVLWRRKRGYLVIRNAQVLQDDGNIAEMSGEVLIDSTNVDFIQVLALGNSQ